MRGKFTEPGCRHVHVHVPLLQKYFVKFIFTSAKNGCYVDNVKMSG